MLLIMCHAGAHRYAIDSRSVGAVLPRANLHRPAGSPPWLAGVLIYRGTATPVIDFTQLIEGSPCAGRFSTRIVLLQAEMGGVPRQFGLLAERVGLREVRDDSVASDGVTAGPTALGRLRLDEQGVYELIDIPRLVPDERQAVLFPAVGRED